jgi:hypothetical protein
MEGINATAAAGLRSKLAKTGDGLMLMDLITVLLGMMHGVVVITIETSNVESIFNV